MADDANRKRASSPKAGRKTPHLLAYTPDVSENTPLPSYTPTVALHSQDTRHTHTAVLHPKSLQPFLTGLQGSGQQKGRILVKPGSSPQEGRLQRDLHAGPPSEASQTPGLRPPPPPPPQLFLQVSPQPTRPRTCLALPFGLSSRRLQPAERSCLRITHLG